MERQHIHVLIKRHFVSAVVFKFKNSQINSLFRNYFYYRDYLKVKLFKFNYYHHNMNVSLSGRLLDYTFTCAVGSRGLQTAHHRDDGTYR